MEEACDDMGMLKRPAVEMSLLHFFLNAVSFLKILMHRKVNGCFGVEKLQRTSIFYLGCLGIFAVYLFDFMIRHKKIIKIE
jgi:hypothetical protein